MKWKIVILILVILMAISYIWYQINIGPCGRPLEYAIGRLDTNFGVSRQDFMKYIAVSEEVWETTSKKELFKYNPEADFKINLIYDERQKTVDQKQKTEFGLAHAESVFKSLDSQFDSLKEKYEGLANSHERAVEAFQKESKQYEADVSYWNSEGGAPEEEYQRLNKRRESINSRIAILNNEALLVNKMSAELGTLLAKRNEAADKYNDLVESYNKKFGAGLEFDQAEYTGKGINIYEFKEREDLEIVLAHEFGHALGMNHVQNSKSIMYYLSGNQTLFPTPTDRAELKTACKLEL